MTHGRVIFVVFFVLAATPARQKDVHAAGVAREEAFADGVKAYQAGDWLRAASHFDRCRTESNGTPRHRQATFYLAEVHVQLGNHSRARQLYETFLADEGDDPRVTVIRARFRLGEMSFLLQEHDRSQRELRDFLEQYPDDDLAVHAAAYLDDFAVRQRLPQTAESLLHGATAEEASEQMQPSDAGHIADEIVSRRQTVSLRRAEGRDRLAAQEAARIKVLEAFQREHAGTAGTHGPVHNRG